jgi:hypothetical protein
VQRLRAAQGREAPAAWPLAATRSFDYAPRVFWRKIGVALCFAVMMSGCQASSPENVPLGECPDVDFSPCDRDTSACRKRMADIAACVYPIDAKTPSVRVQVMTEQELTSELDGGLDEVDADAMPHLERALGDLGLVESGALTKKGGETAGIVARISGIYRDAKHGIVLIDRDGETESEKDAELIRELVRAREDAEYDLASWQEQQPSDTDARLAVSSVPDGHATFVQYRALAALAGYDASNIDWGRTFVNLLDRELGAIWADDSPYLATLAKLPGAFGAGLTNVAWQADGSSSYASAFDAPPQTTLALIAKSRGKDVPNVAAPPFAAPATTDEYTLQRDTALGAFLLALSVDQLGGDDPDPIAMALEWRGDEFWVYAGPDDSTAWIWELQLSDDSTAEKVRGVAKHAHLTAESADDRVFIVGGDEPPEFLSDAGHAFLDADR